jgi:hypothetical protein
MAKVERDPLLRDEPALVRALLRPRSVRFSGCRLASGALRYSRLLTYWRVDTRSTVAKTKVSYFRRNDGDAVSL